MESLESLAFLAASSNRIVNGLCAATLNEVCNIRMIFSLETFNDKCVVEILLCKLRSDTNERDSMEEYDCRRCQYMQFSVGLHICFQAGLQ